MRAGHHWDERARACERDGQWRGRRGDREARLLHILRGLGHQHADAAHDARRGREKGAKADKPAPIAPPKGEKDGLAWTAGQDKRPAAEAPPPEPLPTLSVKGYGAAEKRKIFDALVRYKVRTGPGWTERVSTACGGDVSRETLRAIVVDGLMVDIHVWRVIERGLGDLGAMEKKA